MISTLDDQVRIVDTITNGLWQELVERTPSDVFHSPAWHRVLHETYGFAPQGHLLVGADGLAHAGLVSCRLEDFRGDRLVSLPFSDYCDPLVMDQASWSRLATTLSESGVAFQLRCLWNRLPLASEEFQGSGHARWHGIDLASDPDLVWSNLSGSARRAVRKAEKSGLHVRAARDEAELRSFYELHLGVRKRKYGLLAQPYRFFTSIWRHFIETGDGTLLLAFKDERIVGGVLLLQWRDRLYYKFNASEAGSLTIRPNDLLIWNAILHGFEKGLSLLDFGLSDWDQEGLVRYKRKFASREGEILFIERRGTGVGARQWPDAQLLPALSALFADDSVPDSVTERAGELLYRYFA